MHGWVTIGFKGDTKDLEKDIKRAESELRRYESEAERLTKQKTKAEIDLSEYEKEKAIIKELTNDSLKYAQSQSEIEIHLKQENALLSELDQKYSKQLGTLQEINGKIKSNTNNQELMKNKVQELNKELAKAKGFGDIRGQLEGIGNSMSNVIHKVAKWGLAIFGIRSAYRFVRLAVSELTAHNEQLATDIQYVRYALASTLEPIIMRIVKWAQLALYYLAYIIKAWTGKNPFKSANKGLEKTTSGLKSANKEAKKLEKTLAGFDEMNILQKDGSVASGGGGGGVGGAMPSVDLADLDNVKIPKWIQWIAKNKKIVLGFFKGLATAIAGIKLAKFITELTKMNDAMKLTKQVGIALMITGIMVLVKEISSLIFHWDELSTKEKIWKIALAALGAAIIAFGYAIAAGISAATLGIGAIIAAVVALITTIASLIIKLAKEEKGIKSVTKAQEDLTEAKEKAKEAEDEYITAIKEDEEAQKDLKDAQNETGYSGKKLYEQVQNGTLTYKEMNAEQRRVYEAYRRTQTASERLKTAENNLKTATDNLKIAQWEERLATDNQAESFSKGGKKATTFRDDVIKAWRDGKLETKDAQKLIGKAMSGMSKDAEKTFTKDLPSDIQSGLDPWKYKSFWQKFKNDWKRQLSELNGTVSIGVAVGGFRIGSKLKKIFSAKGAIVTPPKLAVGGVVNRPGQGVSLGNAIIGEAGAEGVIPLTDSQQMALLGEAIGRYITINANITNTMNGRVISREVQKIQNQNDFVANR